MAAPLTKHYNEISFGKTTFKFCRQLKLTRLITLDIVISLTNVATAVAVLTTAALAVIWIKNHAPVDTADRDATAPPDYATGSTTHQYPTAANGAGVAGSAPASIETTDVLNFNAEWARSIYQIAWFAPRPLLPRNAVTATDEPIRQQSAPTNQTLLPDPNDRTAVYDIAAHTVYLPNGNRLEAHSGLGNRFDDPRYVSVKDRGSTPPHVYELALREGLFHGVQAIRLKPVGGGTMFGRDGILAHPYIMSSNGQSNGCVAFKDYPYFLHAYLSGEVDRLLVVPYLGNTSGRLASAHPSLTWRYADIDP